MKILVFLFSLLPCLIQAQISFDVSGEARFYQAAIPGIKDFRASWSAVIERDGKRAVLSSADNAGKGSKEAIRFPKEQAELLLEWEYNSRNKTISIRTGIRNFGRTPLQLLETIPVSAIFRATGNASDWSIVGMHPRTPHAVDLANLESPLDLREYGGVYRHDGQGFFWGPAGIPTAYLSTHFTRPEAELVAMVIKAEMCGVQVDSGETRWGQQAVLLMEAPEQAVPRWAEMVAISHRARAKKTPLTGWNNGNPLAERPVKEELFDVTDAVIRSGGLLHLGVVQIERGEGTPDNLQTLNAPWIPDAAKRVAAIGSLFGIRLGFCNQKREAMIAAVRKAKNLGFNYLKIERPEASVQRGSKETTFEALRSEFESIRQAVGEDVRLAYCADAPDRAVVGMVDESRVGRAAKRSDLRAALGDVALSLPLCGKWFAADLDNVYLGVTWIKNESRLEGSWLSGRLWLSLVGLAAGTAMTSDPVYAPEFKPLWKNLGAVSPPLNGSLSVPGLLTKADASRIVAEVNREWGRWKVAILWNPREGERVVELDFAQIGLDPKRSYAVWGYWDNRIQGVVQGSWKSHYLKAPDFQLLRLTELNTFKSQPTLVGSSLHVSCGAEEIQSVKIGLSTMVIELSRAGMQNGDLYVHSYFPPVLKNVLGCTVEGISLVTENIWRIRLGARDLSGPQRIELDFLLPLTRQVWFWISVVAVASSLLLTLWRYIVSLRLQREQSLAVERARIAQDLHDDLGASLAQISYHGDFLLESSVIAEAEARRIEKMRQIARATTHSLDEIVWAVDPKQDTFESFAGYLCGFAQELLADSRVKCRFDFPDQLPATPLPSKVRHNLFLAFKEALYNILRHSGATEVRISLKPGDKENFVEIKDNGKGFEPSRASGRPQGGHGLGGMRKRMSAIDGRCELNSVEGRGTEVRFFWKSKL